MAVMRLLSRVDRWLLDHDRVLTRLGWVLVFCAWAWFAGSSLR